MRVGRRSILRSLAAAFAGSILARMPLAGSATEVPAPKGWEAPALIEDLGEFARLKREVFLVARAHREERERYERMLARINPDWKGFWERPS